MKITELADIIGSFGWPCAAGRFGKPQTAPFAVVRADSSNNIYSDHEMIKRAEDYIVEFYYRLVEDRLTFEDELTKHFIWQRYTADIAITDDKTVLMAGYNLIGRSYEHFIY